MAAATSGRYTKGDKKGWRWELYQDPASPTGWTKKEFDPRDDSNGGKPTEYFGWYDRQADLEDDAQAEAKAQAKAQADAARTTGDRQSLADRQDAADKQRESELSRQYGNYGADRTSRETVAREGNQSSERNTAASNKERMAELDRRLKEDRREFDLKNQNDQADLDLRRAGLGADILKTGAGLRGADDLVQGWGYAQGVSNAGLSPYVNAIRTGTATPYGGGTAVAGNPTPLTVGSLANAMGAGGGAPQTGTDAFGRPVLPADKQAFVNSVDQNLQKGIANNPLGFLENMTPDQKKGYFSAASWLGRDANAEETYYNRSRPGQGSYL